MFNFMEIISLKILFINTNLLFCQAMLLISDQSGGS